MPIRRPRRVTVYSYPPGQDIVARIATVIPRGADVYIGDDELLCHWRTHPAAAAVVSRLRHACLMKASQSVMVLVEPSTREYDDAVRLCSGDVIVACLQDSKAALHIGDRSTLPLPPL